MHIIARTRYVVEIPELARLGADDVIPEEFETSIEIFARVLAQYGVARQEVERLEEQIRASHYEALRGGARLDFGTVAGVPRMAVARIRIPTDSPFAGQTVAQSELRTRTGALIVSVRRGADDLPASVPEFRLAADDELVVMGEPHQLTAARELLTGRG